MFCFSRYLYTVVFDVSLSFTAGELVICFPEFGLCAMPSGIKNKSKRLSICLKTEPFSFENNTSTTVME